MGDLKKIAYRIVGISIFLMQLFSQIGLVNIYTSHCKASLKTLQRVSKCPTNITTYEEAVKQKNCSALSVEAGSCVSFQYHCVLNEDLQFLVEICAPAIIITGHVCAKFSTKFQSIMSADGMSCEDDNNTCPFNYNSTDAYKYKQCHTKVSRETSSPTIPCSRREESTRKEAEMFVIWFRLLLYLPLLCFTTSIVIFRFLGERCGPWTSYLVSVVSNGKRTFPKFICIWYIFQFRKKLRTLLITQEPYSEKEWTGIFTRISDQMIYFSSKNYRVLN
ncbi:uncharacterized protein LOC111113260 isoform X7 [Crassostrea virginica]